jgi:hypothetical protein
MSSSTCVAAFNVHGRSSPRADESAKSCASKISTTWRIEPTMPWLMKPVRTESPSFRISHWEDFPAFNHRTCPALPPSLAPRAVRLRSPGCSNERQICFPSRGHRRLHLRENLAAAELVLPGDALIELERVAESAKAARAVRSTDP